MTLFNLIIISIIQGITEFLPISSSAHLILLPQAVGFEDQGQIIDVAVHLGTLIAVVLYFWVFRAVQGAITYPKRAFGSGINHRNDSRNHLWRDPET